MVAVVVVVVGAKLRATGRRAASALKADRRPAILHAKSREQGPDPLVYTRGNQYFRGRS